nr:GntR family transcriptional regulator [Chelatococcus sp. HY11]
MSAAQGRMMVDTTSETTKGRRAGQPRIQPLYHQIYIHLRQLLTETELDTTEALPSEPALAVRYGVSRVTIRKTLDQLESEGLIIRVHGKGTYPARATGPQDKANISSGLDNLLSFESRTSAVNLGWEMVTVDDMIAQQLDSPRCLRITRLRSREGAPMSYTTLHVPERYAHLLEQEETADEPIVRALDRKGVSAQRAEQVISAIAAPAAMARHLNVKAGAPLIVMRRLLFDQNHIPVLYQESRYPPDRFEYRMTLNRLSVGPVAQWGPTA